MAEEKITHPDPTPHRRRTNLFGFLVALLLTAGVTAGLTALLISIFWHKVEATTPYVRLVEVTEDTIDPAVWAKNWPREYDTYRLTVDTERTKFGGSEIIPTEHLDRDPWLKRMFAGYAFGLSYTEERGHAYMLSDQEKTKRVTDRPQPGACLHCHASVLPMYRKLGNGDVHKGFEESCKMSYQDAHKALVDSGGAHALSCVDCHDPRTMSVRVTRPGFLDGIQRLAASDAPVPHLPSIERWRKGSKAKPYDPNMDASRQEMRTFTCAQCHVEYYCGPKQTLTFPWGNGLKVEQIEAFWNNTKFPDGHAFFDWKHGETGAEVLKAQHPEFEMWSQGVHARAGVACADCHMPYMRDGATKISNHHVRSPLLNMHQACGQCHNWSEQDLRQYVETIQGRTRNLLDQGGKAITDMIDAILAAKKAGATDDELRPILALQRSAQFRLDFVYAENSMGFHAPQEAARILGEAIDLARQAQVQAVTLAANRGATPRPSTQPVAAAAGR
jgi:nitrite reductase (cytochrome c-552)